MRPRLRKIADLIGFGYQPPPRREPSARQRERPSADELRSAGDLKRKLDATRERLRNETPERRDAA